MIILVSKLESMVLSMLISKNCHQFFSHGDVIFMQMKYDVID